MCKKKVFLLPYATFFAVVSDEYCLHIFLLYASYLPPISNGISLEPHRNLIGTSKCFHR